MSIYAKIRPDSTMKGTTPTALALLESARQGLASDSRHGSTADMWAAARLAALRAAAAVVVARTNHERPGGRRAPQSVWEQLPRAEPALSGWADYFATAGPRLASGRHWRRTTSRREANKLLRNAETFVSLAEGTLGMEAPEHALVEVRLTRFWSSKVRRR
jgi:hypothetical protein